MRILALADVHGALDVYRWLPSAAHRERADVVVIAGDLFEGGWEHEQAAEAQRINSLLHDVPVPVLYLMGNDDSLLLGADDDRVVFIHGRRWESGGYAFVGYQFTPIFMGTVFERTEIAIEADAVALDPLLDDRTVFITHGPVYSVLDRTFGGKHVGSRALGKLLQRRPVLAHIHGHIHESFGRSGNHFNVAAAAQRRAVLVELPGLRHRVVTAENAAAVAFPGPAPL